MVKIGTRLGQFYYGVRASSTDVPVSSSRQQMFFMGEPIWYRPSGQNSVIDSIYLGPGEMVEITDAFMNAPPLAENSEEEPW